LGIEKIQQNRLFRLSGVVLGFGQIIQPADIQGHGNCLLSRDWGRLRPVVWKKHKHFWSKGKGASAAGQGGDAVPANTGREGWITLPRGWYLWVLVSDDSLPT
jgi:hypothetical protein